MTNKSVNGGDSTVYTYNLQNRLKTATIGTGNTIAYKYDLQGIRISKQIGTASAETYLIDPQNPTGYGMMLGSSNGSDAASNAGTSMLYAGEQWDSSADMYYTEPDTIAHQTDYLTASIRIPATPAIRRACTNTPIVTIIRLTELTQAD